jgi:hypothetical protein
MGETLVEFKKATLSGKSFRYSLNNRVGKAAEKADMAIVKIYAPVQENTLKQMADGYFGKYEKLNEITLYVITGHI